MPKRTGCLLSLFTSGKDMATELPYEQSEGILTQAERSFYGVLHEALEVMGLRAMVCPKVGLRDVFRVVTQDNSEYMAYLNKIDRKHVDFLLADPRGFTPIAGVELDDSSHLSERVKARDAFVEEVYQTAGLPFLRFRVQHTYDIPDMVRYMREELNLPETFVTADEPARKDNPAQAGEPVLSFEPETQASREEISAATTPDMPDTPLCPRCGAPMILRKARRGKLEGQFFWGCSRFPRCQYVLEMKKDKA